MGKIKQKFLLNLKFKPSLIVYINLRNDSLAEHVFSIKQMDTSMIQNSIIYTKELELFKDYDYQYFYTIKENELLKNEIRHRNFKYDSETQFKPDEWDKTWVLYRVTYKESTFQEDCLVEIIANGHSLKLQPKNETKQLEASEMITNAEELRQFQISLKDQKRMGKKINVANYKKCKMNQIIVPFSTNSLHLDHEENELNTHIEQNFNVFQTELDPEKQKEEQYRLEIKKKEKQINHLKDRLTVLQNESQEKDIQLTKLKTLDEQLNQSKLQEQKKYYENKIKEYKDKYYEELDQGNQKCDQIFNQYRNLQQTLDFTPLQDSLTSSILDQSILKNIQKYQVKVIEINTLKREEQKIMLMDNGEKKAQKQVEFTTQLQLLHEQAQDILSSIKEDCQKVVIADSLEESADYKAKIQQLQKKYESEIQVIIADSLEETAEYKMKIQELQKKCESEKQVVIADSLEEIADYKAKIQKLCQREIQQSRDFLESSEIMKEKLQEQIKKNKTQEQIYRTEIQKFTQAYQTIQKELEDAQKNIFEPFFQNQFEYQSQISIRYQQIAKQQITEKLYELRTATNQAVYAGMQLSNSYELYKNKLIPVQEAILQQINEINDTCSLNNLYTLFQNVTKLSNFIGLIEDLETNEADEEISNLDFDQIQNIRQQRTNMDRILWSLEKLKEVLQKEQNLSISLETQAQFITQLYLKLTDEVNQKIMVIIQNNK